MHKNTNRRSIAQRVAMHARVLAELKAFKGLTTRELAEVMDRPRKSVDRYVLQLYAEQRIHIGSWQQRSEGSLYHSHSPAKVWRAGKGVDAKRPDPEPRSVTQARYRSKNGVMVAARRAKPDSIRPNIANNPFYQLMA